MKLYHFTHQRHLENILADGYLKTTESNIGGPPIPAVLERIIQEHLSADIGRGSVDHHRPVGPV